MQKLPTKYGCFKISDKYPLIKNEMGAIFLLKIVKQLTRII